MTEQQIKIPSFTEALALFLGGEKVEMKESGADNWYKMTRDCLNSSVLDLMGCDYRKKPEPKTRLMTAEDYTRLEEENKILRDKLSKFDDIKRRVNNMPYDDFLKLLSHYFDWIEDIKERFEDEPTEASCEFPRLKSSMAQLITRDEYFGSYKKEEQGE